MQADAGLRSLATAGAHGAHASNIERDVLRRAMPNRYQAWCLALYDYIASDMSTLINYNLVGGEDFQVPIHSVQVPLRVRDRGTIKVVQRTLGIRFECRAKHKML